MFVDPATKVTSTEWARVAALLFKRVQKDNNLSEKLEARRMLMRSEQRAFNQRRKRSLAKNNKTKLRGLACDI